jgi:site-specific DNA-methyltransferase (adenine-specific)
MGLLDMVDYRQGKWQEVLADVEADHLIIDAPYSARTHKGGELSAEVGKGNGAVGKFYACWGREDVAEVCAWAKDHISHWVVSMTDHVLFPIWEEELTKRGYYVFAPVVLVETGRNVRLRGDGPACWATLLVVARPRTRDAADWRALTGAYVVPRDNDKMMGGKPLTAMRQIVRDYSDKGDTIVDLCAGNATTLIAAAVEGRRAIGAEMDPATWQKGNKRLSDRLYWPLFDGPHTQQPLL